MKHDGRQGKGQQLGRKPRPHCRRRGQRQTYRPTWRCGCPRCRFDSWQGRRRGRGRGHARSHATSQPKPRDAAPETAPPPVSIRCIHPSTGDRRLRAVPVVVVGAGGRARGEHNRAGGARVAAPLSRVPPFWKPHPLSPPPCLARVASPCLHLPLPLLPPLLSSSHGPHGRSLRPPPPPQRHGQARFPRRGPDPDPVPGSRQSHPSPRLRLPDAQLGRAPPPPLLQGRRRPGVSAAAPAHAVAGQGEAAAGLVPRRSGRVAAPAAVEPPHPPLRHRRAARVEIGRRREGAGVGGWSAPAAARVAAAAGAGGRAQEEDLLRCAHQGGDRRGLRRHPWHPPAAPAQEAPARRAAPARRKDFSSTASLSLSLSPLARSGLVREFSFARGLLNPVWFRWYWLIADAVPGAVSRRRESGLVQDRRGKKSFSGLRWCSPTSFPFPFLHKVGSFLHVPFFLLQQRWSAPCCSWFGGAFQMFPAFPFFVRWLSHGSCGSCGLEGGIVDFQC